MDAVQPATAAPGPAAPFAPADTAAGKDDTDKQIEYLLEQALLDAANAQSGQEIAQPYWPASFTATSAAAAPAIMVPGAHLIAPRAHLAQFSPAVTAAAAQAAIMAPGAHPAIMAPGAHLADFSPAVTAADTVQQQQLVGGRGNTAAAPPGAAAGDQHASLKYCLQQYHLSLKQMMDYIQIRLQATEQIMLRHGMTHDGARAAPESAV
eukprot:gene8560-8742_t